VCGLYKSVKIQVAQLWSIAEMSRIGAKRHDSATITIRLHFVQLQRVTYILLVIDGTDQGGFVGFGRSPPSLRDKNLFEAILVGRGLNLVRWTVYIGWHGKGGWVVQTGLEESSQTRSSDILGKKTNLPLTTILNPPLIERHKGVNNLSDVITQQYDDDQENEEEEGWSAL